MYPVAANPRRSIKVALNNIFVVITTYLLRIRMTFHCTSTHQAYKSIVTRPHLLPNNTTRLNILDLLTRRSTRGILLRINILRCDRAASPFRNTSGFCSLIVVDEQLSFLAVASRHLSCNIDHRENALEAMYLVEDLVHLLERAARGFRLGKKKSDIEVKKHTDITHIEEVDARHHEGVDDGEDDVSLERQLLATPNKSRWSDDYLVANAVKRNGTIVILSAPCSHPIEIAVYLRHHHNHEVPNPAGWSA